MAKFTAEDQAKLDALVAKRATAQAEELEARRTEEAESFKPVLKLLKKLDDEELRTALNDALNADGLSTETRTRLMRFQQIFAFDIEDGLIRERDRLAQPVLVNVDEPTPPPAPPAE